MSLFADIQSNAASTHQRVMGEAVVLTAPSGDTDTITAIVKEYLPEHSSDTDQGVRQVFRADVTIDVSYASQIVAGRGSEVSRFDFNGFTWRAIGKTLSPGALLVQVERNAVQGTKKGWRQGVP